MIAGYGAYSGRGKMIHRLPVLSQPQQGLVLAAAGAIAIVWGMVSLVR